MSLPLYLASRSPRRSELLTYAGLNFRVHVPAEEELPAPKVRSRVSASSIVKRISRAKALAAARELSVLGVKKAVILSADTLVFQKNQVLGKPQNAAEAKKTLRLLSGKWHEVVTGVTVLSIQSGKIKEGAIQVRTKVRFFSLTDSAINWYIATGEPFDKAGAYGCQEFGAFLVREFKGSYTNVVGLPLGETLDLLSKFGAKSLQRKSTGRH